jgi:hypothetical protein
MRLMPLRLSASAFVFAAVGLAAAAVATEMLPTQCGVVGRPNADALAVDSIIGGGVLLLVGIVAVFAAKNQGRVRRTLGGVALMEVACWVGVLVFYLHQTIGSYPNCG